MKRKGWLILAGVALLLLLVIPIPTDVARDGGTRSYTALTYKIVNWHHVGTDAVYEGTRVYPFPQNFLSLDELLERGMAASATGGSDEQACDFAVQYICTDGGRDDIDYPAVAIIRSTEELRAYYEANREFYDLGRRDSVAADTTIGFLDACDRYDDAYFARQLLVLVLLEEPSGSNRHQVTGVTLSEANGEPQLAVTIDTLIPEIGTHDMALWHILIEPEAGVTVADEAAVTVWLDGVNTAEKPTLATCSKGAANMSLLIPQGWAYEIEDADDGTDFGIRFWPDGHDEGALELWYNERFGVCGTGLQVETVPIGRYTAEQGTYQDGNGVWAFLHVNDMPGNYVVYNEGDAAWWDAYGEEAMAILGTAKLGEGILTKSAAISMAEKVCTVSYDRVSATFSAADGVWEVCFYRSGNAGGDQTVRIGADGRVLDSVYGE